MSPLCSRSAAPAGDMRKDVLGIATYLAIAFGMAWAAWEIPLRLGLSIQSAWFQIPALIGAFSPAVAGIVVRRFVTREGFADAGLEPFPRKWLFYLAALLIPLAVAFAT